MGKAWLTEREGAGLSTGAMQPAAGWRQPAPWGRAGVAPVSAGPEQAGRTLCRAALALGSSAAQLSGHPRPSRWLPIYLPLRSMSAGPRAAVAPSPLLPLPTRARAFDSGPAANGFVMEALQNPRRRCSPWQPHSGPGQGAQLLAWEWWCKSVPGPQLPPMLLFTQALNPTSPPSPRGCGRPVSVRGPGRRCSCAGLSPCLPPGLELSEWKGSGGQGSGGAA